MPLSPVYVTMQNIFSSETRGGSARASPCFCSHVLMDCKKTTWTHTLWKTLSWKLYLVLNWKLQCINAIKIVSDYFCYLVLLFHSVGVFAFSARNGETCFVCTGLAVDKYTFSQYTTGVFLFYRMSQKIIKFCWCLRGLCLIYCSHLISEAYGRVCVQTLFEMHTCLCCTYFKIMHI